MPRVRLLPMLAFAATAVLGGTAGACGGSDDESATPATQATTSTTTEAAVTPLRFRLEKEMRALLKRGGAANAVDVDCVIEELRATLSNELVEAATEAADQGEEIPTEAVDAAYAAGQECAKR